MPALFANNAATTLASSINAVQTSISVTSGAGALFPNPTGTEFFYATLVDASNNIEIIKVTARAGDAFTCVRGQEGTTARAYTAGDKVELRVTADGLNSKFDKEGGAINGASPQGQLSVRAAAGVSAIRVDNPSGSETVDVYSRLTAGYAAIYAGGAALGVGTTSAQNLNLVTNNAIRAVVESNGNVAFISGISIHPLSGIVRANGTNPASALAVPSGDLVGTTATQTLSNKTLSGVNAGSTINFSGNFWELGYRDAPISIQGGDFTLSSDLRGRTVVLVKGSAQAVYVPPDGYGFPLGATVILFNNQTVPTYIYTASGSALIKPLAGYVSSLTLPAWGIATCIYLGSSTWVVSGTGIT